MSAPFLFFFVSGACALVYQVVWVRQLLLLTGSTTAAVSTVLAIFMAGLGAGAWLFGARADRARSPLKLYGYLELGIGIYALLLPRLLAAATPTYVELARDLAGRPGLLLVLRVTLGALVLAVPTVLMGGTLPVLVRYVGRRADRFGADLGRLYGANLLGGVAGSLAAGFVLIRTLGVEGATLAAVAANLAIALLALVWGAREATPPASDAAEVGLRLEMAPSARPWVWAAVVFSGFVTMAYEVLWTRILVFAFTSTVYAFTLILSTFLTGLALGSRLFVSIERRPRPLQALAAAQILAGLAALVFTPLSTRAADLIGQMMQRFGSTGGVFLGATALTAALVMLVPATLMGLVLPLGMRLLVDDLARAGRRVGTAYLSNTLGSMAGSLLAGFVLIPILGLKRTLLVVAALQVALGWALLPHLELEPRRRRGALALSAGLLVTAAVAASVMLAGPAPFDRRLARWPGAVIEAHRDAVGASFTVVRAPEIGTSLRIDGFDAATAGLRAAYMPMMTHIPMLLHPEPRRLLVICFGTGGTAGAGLLHRDATIDVVDINPTVFEMATYFSEWNHGVAADRRARLIADDGRNFLLTTRESYDVITSEPMPPGFAGVVNLYSREYYELARERLRPGGLVVQWLPLHLVSADHALRILKTVQAVFPETALWMHAGTGIIVGRRDGEIAVDLPRLAHAFGDAALARELAAFGVRQPMDFARLVALSPSGVRDVVVGVPVVTDDRPALEFDRPRPPAQDYRPLPALFTTLPREAARAVEIFYRRRLGDRVPVRGASADESSDLARWLEMDTRRVLGGVYAAWDQPDLAVAELERAAAAAHDEPTRAALRAEALRLRETSSRGR